MMPRSSVPPGNPLLAEAGETPSCLVPPRGWRTDWNEPPDTGNLGGMQRPRWVPEKHSTNPAEEPDLGDVG